ncbi:RNA polymerase sigma factor [Herbiconiux daphne]|uniref:Sigma-70 family RNA polymerase sigma factor n=1 Tax=Herbiconiux daphne TaxID=2970914 RepID=A0ABT2GXG3_9MICO|nr:sigma-70 family RNA polymerase sigma factor [Herbiconiux daphne]MCS5732648.1 sigma-70 family RNA polymerase sigma factor [Herbiconiux daphne]
MEDPSDERRLIDRAREGDTRAFDQLLSPHRDRLWGVCLRITANTADADDAVQECLVAVWQNLGSFRSESRFSTWLFRIASNAALAVVRRRREFATEIAEFADERQNFADDLAERDRIQRAIELVPEEFRVTLVLREYGGLSYDEIAAHQGILVQTVKSRLHRARAAMRDALAEV